MTLRARDASAPFSGKKRCFCSDREGWEGVSGGDEHFERELSRSPYEFSEVNRKKYLIVEEIGLGWQKVE